MQIVELKSTYQVEDILNGITQLETNDLEDFLKRVSLILAKRKAPSLSKRETILLKTINHNLDNSTRIQFRTLRQKQVEGKLTIAEKKELLRLVEVVENADVVRLKAMIELSQIRETTLDDLMEQLGITQSLDD